MWRWVCLVAWWCAWCGGAGAQQDARLEGLYAKLERLERLTELEADGGGGADAARQLEMVAALAAAAPDLSPDQLELLLTDLRDTVHAPAPAPAPAPTATVNYADDEDDDDEDGWQDMQRETDGELLVDYPLMDEVEGSETGEADEGWEPGTELKEAALRHWLYMQTAAAATCAEPALHSVCVQDVHPHAGKLYLPKCVLLHRCAAETGCCLNNAHVCAPLPSHLRLVRLPLYVLTVGSGNTEERLPFVNHTRCTCANRTQVAAAARAASELLATTTTLPPPEREDTTPSGGGAGGMASDDSTRRPHAHRAADAPPPTTLASHFHRTEEPPAAVNATPLSHRTCRCPRGFEPAGAGCTCECRQRDCANLAKGKEHFGLADRLCIKRLQCAPPRCDLGPYLRAAGRCPRRRAAARRLSASAPVTGRMH